MKTKHMDHNAYPETLKGKTWAELHFIARDAQETLKVNPDNDNSDYYQDEINYVCNELNARHELGYYGPRD